MLAFGTTVALPPPAGRWRGSALGQHIAAETLVSVCDGAPDAVTFQRDGCAGIAAWVIWAHHRWIKALASEALSRAGMATSGFQTTMRFTDRVS